MSVATDLHRLDGLEPDNVLAFLALLGLLRALNHADDQMEEAQRWHPRAGWTLDAPPLRPMLLLARTATAADVADAAARGVKALAESHDFAGRKDLNYSREDCRAMLEQAAVSAGPADRRRVDLLASLMTDAAVKDDKNGAVDPTPFCLLFGQGHQHFLERLACVPQELAPPPRGRGRNARHLTASDCLAEALFQPWHRRDPTFSFRWDPNEAIRYALMAGDPTDDAYKPGTQHGANRLAAIGIAGLTMTAEARAGRIRPAVIGGAYGKKGEFSFAWPLWRGPASYAAIRALLAHPALRRPAGLVHLGVDHVMVTRRIPLLKYMNFTRARIIAPEGQDHAER